VYHHHDGHIHSLRVFAPLDAPLHAVVACAREVDLIPSWNKFVLAARMLQDFEPMRVRAGCKLWTPLPLPRANIVVDVLMRDELDQHGCLLIVAATPTPGVPSALLPAELRALISIPAESLVRLTPRDASGCDVELIMWVPAAHVPSILIDALVYVAAPWVYQAAIAMLQTALSADAPLGQRIASGGARELYAQIASRCADHVRARRDPPRPDAPPAAPNGRAAGAGARSRAPRIGLPRALLDALRSVASA
jgi:hypothetical protein